MGTSGGGQLGKDKGRPKKNRLADMTVVPEQRRYQPPPVHACDPEITVPIRLPEPGHELRVRFRTYRNHIVDFAVVQIVRVDGMWINVAKIDCDRGVIHRHQYIRTGQDIYDHRPLQEIPPDRGREVVDRWYQRAVDMMEDEWEENLRRWNGDHA